MKKLNDNEIKELCEALMYFSLDETEDLAAIFYDLKKCNSICLEGRSLDSVDDYVEEYNNRWYTYSTFKELVESEEDQGSDGLTEEGCRNEIDLSIFLLKSGRYIQCVY